MTDDRGFSIVGSRSLLELSFLDIQMRQVRTPGGEVVDRVVIVHPGAVAVVPVIDGEVVVIEQYRAPASGVVIEIPAGKYDTPDEDPKSTARRELVEEVGLTADRLTFLTEIYTTVGFTDERIAIFLAEGLHAADRTPVGAEEEAATIRRIPLPEARRMVIEGTIVDAKSVVGILLAAAHLGTP